MKLRSVHRTVFRFVRFWRMGELNFDPETVDALLADAVPVLSAENFAWQRGAPQAMVDLVVATVEPDQQLSAFPPQP